MWVTRIWFALVVRGLVQNYHCGSEVPRDNNKEAEEFFGIVLQLSENAVG